MSIAGSLFGLAYGDAMGKPTEFMKFDAISKVHGKHGPRDLPGRKLAKVTDDTQMALYVGNAVAEAAETGYLEPGHVTVVLEKALAAWYRDPENTGDRAPGTACMSACRKIANGKPWWEATNPNSKGCGANMRVTPVGLAHWLTAEQRSGIAQLQAAMTHWHPTALAAADVTQEAVHLLFHGADHAELLDLLIDYTRVAARRDPRVWLGDLVENGKVVSRASVDEWMSKGWVEVRNVLQDVQWAWRPGMTPSRKADPCKVGGEGWVAEEALGTALHCFLLYPHDAAGAVGRAAASNGDSDSIAALAGAFVGAALGAKAFPASWLGRIEYAVELEALALRLA